RHAQHEGLAVRLLGHELPDLLGGYGCERDQRNRFLRLGRVLDCCHARMVADGSGDSKEPDFVTLVSLISRGLARTFVRPEKRVLGFARDEIEVPRGGTTECSRTGCR